MQSKQQHETSRSGDRHVGPEPGRREGKVPVTGESPPVLRALFSASPGEDGYWTLAGWFLIFFWRIFTFAADIFYREQHVAC